MAGIVTFYNSVIIESRMSNERSSSRLLRRGSCLHSTPLTVCRTGLARYIPEILLVEDVIDMLYATNRHTGTINQVQHVTMAYYNDSYVFARQSPGYGNTMGSR